MAEANSINAATTGIVGNTGTAFTGTPVTNHATILGGATYSTLGSVGPSATSGAVFIGQGASADPKYTTGAVMTENSSFAISGAASGAQMEIDLVNTSVTASSPTRIVLSNASASGNGDDYIFFNNGTAFEAGYKASTDSFVVQYAPTNTHAYMDGTTAFSISNVGVPSFPAAPLPVSSGGTGVTASNPIIQQVRTSTSALVHCTTALPIDDTIPTSSEGTQVLTVTITPKNTANILVIECNLFAAINTSGDNWGVALFQDATSAALAATFCTSPGAGNGLNAVLVHSMTAGTTSATTFKIRAGGNTNNLDVNGAGNNTRLFGGVANTNLQVTEYSA